MITTRFTATVTGAPRSGQLTLEGRERHELEYGRPAPVFKDRDRLGTFADGTRFTHVRLLEDEAGEETPLEVDVEARGRLAERCVAELARGARVRVNVRLVHGWQAQSTYVSLELVSLHVLEPAPTARELEAEART